MSQQGAPQKNTITTITDVNGEVVLEIKQEEYLVVRPDGSFEAYTHYHYITLVDGSGWAPQLMWQSPAALVGVCGVCRKRSLFRRKRPHGLVLLARAHHCECGFLCCPKHSVRCSDRVWRCRKCAIKYWFKKLLRPLFWERIEE